MSLQQGAARPPGTAGPVVARASARAWGAVRRLAGGLGTAVPALAVLAGVLATAALCLVGVGLLLAPHALRAVHAVAGLERTRLGRWGIDVPDPGPVPAGLRAAAAHPTTRRELAWLGAHAVGGLLLGLAGVMLPLFALRDLTFPLYWWAVPEGSSSTSVGLGTVDGWTDAVASALLGVGWLAVLVGLAPGMARLQAWPATRLLGPPAGTDLSLRVAELTASRAAALDAHGVELRRIERALHDGTQNRLVAVTVLLGAAGRAMDRDPAMARQILGRAQDAAEQALAELRAVARGILPPVLADRGLAGALSGLAATCPVPCTVDLDRAVTEGRCAASVEATAYFVVSEALTNVARHAHARQVAVTLRRSGGTLHVQVLDDGRGGADEGRGTGLAGVRRRVEAHDGTLTLASPPGGPTMLAVELPCGS